MLHKTTLKFFIYRRLQKIRPTINNCISCDVAHYNLVFGMPDAIIAGKITNGQFEQSELSFKELDDCILVFKKLLRNINHVRIEYPEEQKKD